MKASQKKSLLLSPLFSGISEKRAQELFPEGSLIVKSHKKGETVFEENDFSRSLGIILKGSAVVEKKSLEKPVIMSTLREGGTFGMAALFYEESVYPTTITAAAQTDVAFISKEALKSAFLKEPRLSENYICLLSQKIHFLNKKIETFSSRGSGFKLYSYLLDEYSKRGKDGKVELFYNMSELSRLLGIGRTTIYRELEELTSSGLIKKDGKTFTILKEENL